MFITRCDKTTPPFPPRTIFIADFSPTKAGKTNGKKTSSDGMRCVCIDKTSARRSLTLAPKLCINQERIDGRGRRRRRRPSVKNTEILQYTRRAPGGLERQAGSNIDRSRAWLQTCTSGGTSHARVPSLLRVRSCLLTWPARLGARVYREVHAGHGSARAQQPRLPGRGVQLPGGGVHRQSLPG